MIVIKKERKNKMELLPRGEYVIADPCYLIRDNWEDLLEKTKHFGKDTGNKRMVHTYRDWKLFVSTTKYGDGTYKATNGILYNVDSGTIGCIPIELCDDYELYSNPRECARESVSIFEEDFLCGYDNGTIIINDIKIVTK